MKHTSSTISSFSYEPTSDKNIFRFVDREGDWTHYWIKNKKKFVPAVNHIIRTGYPKGERFYTYLLNTTPHEAERRLKTAGEEGARTHEAIRDLIDGQRVTLDTRYYNELSDKFEPLNSDEWFNLESFIAWCAKYRPHVISHESTVWSEMYNYAGTIDFVGTILIPDGDKSAPKEVWGKRIMVLLDWKTSGGIWDDYELQTASYRKALLEKKEDKLPTHEYGELWTGIVRLGTAHKLGFEMRLWDMEESEMHFNIFRAAHHIYRRKEGEEFMPKIKQIPSIFEIKIPRIVRRTMKAGNKIKTKNRDRRA